MLLRETCLMSMAHKRVTAPEEKSSSAPPLPWLFFTCRPSAANQKQPEHRQPDAQQQVQQRSPSPPGAAQTQGGGGLSQRL
ncbi:hypothetical protein CgunFtcFv8_012465 [Champsocephalus gunnari]|uniref:Uncharacterized protein n=1 Tax=Champsocephalus gunnari TaxID=52237 RepID=A0AAN8HTI5_CHAGU|nr:hypothetical protein CgunFtcFv8_012465 [Champsocephalus gunnari]